MGLKFFLSIVISSLGAVVFGQNKEEEMATRPVVPNQNRGTLLIEPKPQEPTKHQCIPYRMKGGMKQEDDDDRPCSNNYLNEEMEVLLITSQKGGDAIMFPKLHLTKDGHIMEFFQMLPLLLAALVLPGHLISQAVWMLLIST